MSKAPRYPHLFLLSSPAKRNSHQSISTESSQKHQFNCQLSPMYTKSSSREAESTPQTTLHILVCSKYRAGSKTSGCYCRPNAYKMQTISRLFPACSCWRCWAGREGNICGVYLQSRYSMSIASPSFLMLHLPMYCTSSMPGLNSSQWWENEWGCILLSVLGAIQSPQFMSCKIRTSA